MTKAGFIQIELEAREEDASLLREVAEALADPARRTRLRTLLRTRLVKSNAKEFLAFLEQAPLEGIDLERSPDPGREVEL